MHASRAAALGALALALAGTAASPPAWAQYKVVAPDGSVTYTDRPPAGAAARVSPASTAAPAPAGGSVVPPEVRQPMARFPVTLYGARPCVPCDQARAWLKQRGIPYTEYSVEKATDINQLKGRFGDAQLPVVTIGSQVIKGFSAAELEAYADAAGYPRQSRLANYAWPAAVPLAPPAASVAAPTVPPAPTVPSAAPPPPPPRTGIQF